MSRFITISSESDAWGSNTDDFDIAAEVAKITDAADAAGIEVYDYYSKPRDRDDLDQIDWFSTWCGDGYEWNAEQWQEFFDAVSFDGKTVPEARRCAINVKTNK